MKSSSEIKAVKALKRENLDEEWAKINLVRFRKQVKWDEKSFRFKAIKEGKIIGKIAGKLEAGVVFINSIIT
jgi:hypothetical protein